MKKKSASVRLEPQKAEPFKRRRSLINGRTSSGIETCERDENGWMNLVMPPLLLTGGFNGCGYTAKVHPSTGETKAWILPFVNSQLFERVERRFCPPVGKLDRKKESF
jgi:hypothetical protein